MGLILPAALLWFSLPLNYTRLWLSSVASLLIKCSSKVKVTPGRPQPFQIVKKHVSHSASLHLQCQKLSTGIPMMGGRSVSTACSPLAGTWWGGEGGMLSVLTPLLLEGPYNAETHIMNLM